MKGLDSRGSSPLGRRGRNSPPDCSSVPLTSSPAYIKKATPSCRFLVAEVGLEPTRYCYHQILSLASLPIPSFRLMCIYYITFFRKIKKKFNHLLFLWHLRKHFDVFVISPRDFHMRFSKSYSRMKTCLIFCIERNVYLC